jgi:hypothetical protein
VFTGVCLPAFGFLFCLTIWLNLSKPAKIVGALWFAAGFAFNLWQSRHGGKDVPALPI